MNRADRKRWGQARTLQDLCDLTGAWLQGEIASQPGYYGRVDVDEDQAPGLTAALIAANRAGLLTRTSQAGYIAPPQHPDYPDHPGRGWKQHAALDGLATEETLNRLHKGLQGTDFYCFGNRHGRPVNQYAVPVTFLNDEPYTWFGGKLPKPDLAWQLKGAGRAAIRDVTQHTVTVFIGDRIPGRNTLWPVLQQICSLPVADQQRPQAPQLPNVHLQATSGVVASPPGGDQH
jgi:hypothetical protein